MQVICVNLSCYMPKTKKVLIVEDDSVLGSMYKIKFETNGFTVMVATNGSDGLEKAKKDDFDIILLDIIMPQLDGFSVLAELKKDAKTKEVPVIMLTNLGTEEDKKKGKEMGAVDYIVKSSLTPTQVSDKVKEFLG